MFQSIYKKLLMTIPCVIVLNLYSSDTITIEVAYTARSCPNNTNIIGIVPGVKKTVTLYNTDKKDAIKTKIITAVNSELSDEEKSCFTANLPIDRYAFLFAGYDGESIDDACQGKQQCTWQDIKNNKGISGQCTTPCIWVILPVRLPK